MKLNVTLIFTSRQYAAARDAIWRGAQKRPNLDDFKSVYSIFVSRIDVYTLKQVPSLSSAAAGQVGIANAKRMWAENQAFWSSTPRGWSRRSSLPALGTKKPERPALEIRRGLCRQRHPDESAGHERGGGQEWADVYTGRSIASRRTRC